jgi:E3 ubiquitin-protein ligase RBBP6
MSSILFKFKGSRAAAERLTFDGISISEQELKNAIAEQKGLDTSRDQYVLLNPNTHVPFPPNFTFVRNMNVEVKRKPLPQGLAGRGRPQQAADTAAVADDPTAHQAMAAAQALSAAAAAAAADPNAQQPDAKLMLEMEAQAVTNMTQAAWQAQTDQHIRNAQQREQQQREQALVRGQGYGRSIRGPGANQPPPICRNCGAAGGLHWPDECPNPRSNMRQVRAPTGIPASFLQEAEGGGLLLHSGRTAAVTADSAAAARVFAALPSARRAALAQRAAQVPAIANRPHNVSADDASDDALLATLLLENEPATP